MTLEGRGCGWDGAWEAVVAEGEEERRDEGWCLVNGVSVGLGLAVKEAWPAIASPSWHRLCLPKTLALNFLPRRLPLSSSGHSGGGFR